MSIIIIVSCLSLIPLFPSHDGWPSLSLSLSTRVPCTTPYALPVSSHVPPRPFSPKVEIVVVEAHGVDDEGGTMSARLCFAVDTKSRACDTNNRTRGTLSRHQSRRGGSSQCCWNASRDKNYRGGGNLQRGEHDVCTTNAQCAFGQNVTWGVL